MGVAPFLRQGRESVDVESDADYGGHCAMNHRATSMLVTLVTCSPSYNSDRPPCDFALTRATAS